MRWIRVVGLRVLSIGLGMERLGMGGEADWV